MDEIPRFDGDARGQTVPDYAVGASLFLVVVGGVLLYIPTIFEPLSTTTTANAIIADRTATYLTTELLNDGGTSATLDAVCTAAFFGKNTSLDSECAFDADSSTRNVLGISDTTDINIAIVDAKDVVADSAITDEIEGVEYRYTRHTDTDQQNTAVATRIVRLDGTSYRLIVEVW